MAEKARKIFDMSRVTQSARFLMSAGISMNEAIDAVEKFRATITERTGVSERFMELRRELFMEQLVIKERIIE